MVSAAVREYVMDVVTKDPSKLRNFIAKEGAPADYSFTPGARQSATQRRGAFALAR
jgi:hypothetical protein